LKCGRIPVPNRENQADWPFHWQNLAFWRSETMMKRCLLLAVVCLVAALSVSAQGSQPIFERGVKQLQANQFADAISSFSEYARVEPTEPAAPFNIGLCYYSLKRYSDALPFFQKAAEL